MLYIYIYPMGQIGIVSRCSPLGILNNDSDTNVVLD